METRRIQGRKTSFVRVKRTITRTLTTFQEKRSPCNVCTTHLINKHRDPFPLSEKAKRDGESLLQSHWTTFGRSKILKSDRRTHPVPARLQKRDAASTSSASRHANLGGGISRLDRVQKRGGGVLRSTSHLRDNGTDNGQRASSVSLKHALNSVEPTNWLKLREFPRSASNPLPPPSRWRRTMLLIETTKSLPDPFQRCCSIRAAKSGREKGWRRRGKVGRAGRA